GRDLPARPRRRPRSRSDGTAGPEREHSSRPRRPTAGRLWGRSGRGPVRGGKPPTHRRMAPDVVDTLTDRACRTTVLPLVGAVGTSAPAPARLVRRYGCEAADVAALADHDPRLLEPVAPGVPVLGVELAWGLRAEGALRADDLLERRTRLSFVDAWHDAARPAAEAALHQSV
ncbi:MAG: hypothetical protein H7323_15125, partial [Frankiales bacterium]|nr:hypothetical protein [Frankiales bacterium]